MSVTDLAFHDFINRPSFDQPDDQGGVDRLRDAEGMTTEADFRRKMLMSAPKPSGWTDAVTRAAWTLLLAAIVIHVAGQLLKQLVVPLVIVVALLGIVRFAVAGRGRDEW